MRLCLCGLAFLWIIASAFGGYHANPWKIRARETYQARLASEGVTIAIEPLFRDSLAGQVFDKSDMLTRGIMPVAIVIFNDNEFAVQIESETIELIGSDGHTHSMGPDEAVAQLSKSKGKSVWKPQIGVKVCGADSKILEDFEAKYLNKRKIVGPHDARGGFLYFRVANPETLREYLMDARIYIPDLMRDDTGNNMIFFEINLKPAIEASPPK